MNFSRSLGSQSVSMLEDSVDAGVILRMPITNRSLHGYVLAKGDGPTSLFDTLMPDSHFKYSDAAIFEESDYLVDVMVRNDQYETMINIKDCRCVFTFDKQNDECSPNFVSFLTSQLWDEYRRRFPGHGEKKIFQFLASFHRYEVGEADFLVTGKTLLLKGLVRQTSLHIVFNTNRCLLLFLKSWLFVRDFK